MPSPRLEHESDPSTSTQPLSVTQPTGCHLRRRARRHRWTHRDGNKPVNEGQVVQVGAVHRLNHLYHPRNTTTSIWFRQSTSTSSCTASTLLVFSRPRRYWAYHLVRRLDGPVFPSPSPAMPDRRASLSSPQRLGPCRPPPAAPAAPRQAAHHLTILLQT